MCYVVGIDGHVVTLLETWLRPCSKYIHRQQYYNSAYIAADTFIKRSFICIRVIVRQHMTTMLIEKINNSKEWLPMTSFWKQLLIKYEYLINFLCKLIFRVDKWVFELKSSLQ